MSKISGSCLCGKVTYSSKAEPAMIAVCHCPDCQKQSGSPFSVNVLVPNDEVDLKGDSLSQFTVTGDSGMPVTRNFCNACGSPITTVLPAFNNLAAVKSGTLDDSSWVEPTIEIWCDSKQPWSKINSEIPTAAKNPG
ncbi:MAG: GFA family protein [Burkholderiaceae bacterium]